MENKEHEEKDVRCVTFLLSKYLKMKKKSGELFAPRCLPS